MKIIHSLLFPVLMFSIFACNPGTDCNKLSENIVAQYNTGNYNTLQRLADSLKGNCPDDLNSIRKADSLVEISGRTALDFSLRWEQVRQRLENYNIAFNDSLISQWEKKNWLEFRVINNEKKYFSRTASNLRLLKLFYEDRKKRDEMEKTDSDLILRKDHTAKVIRESKDGNQPVAPVKIDIKYTITVDADVVPDGETIRCWLPWPKENHVRQQDVTFISASLNNYVIAPDSMVHRTLYMESKAQKGKPTLFSISFSLISSAQYFCLPDLKILPYNKDSELYKKYTKEQLPQICFTEEIRKLADSITESADTPAARVREIYMWFKENIPWTGALEYGIMPNIPEYVFTNRRGDCGMQTFLFMSMLRYKGIPVRWQSGWMVPPGSENLHDWCEVYYEGPGWVPADVSYVLQSTEDSRVKEFYLSGIDSYRLILNDGVAGELFPPKKFMRSEPYDFQRGEVEWRGGNLYFDKWNYNIEIKYN